MPVDEAWWKPMLRVIGGLTLVFVLSFTVRLAWISHAQLELAHKAEQAGHWRRALIHDERAIHPYLPLLPARKQAMREMQTLCRQLEADGNKDLALEGWRRLRGALLAARSMFGQPDQDVLKTANREIARLAAETDTQGMMAKTEIRREAQRLLQQSPKDIHPFWGLMQFLMLILWIVLVGRTIWQWSAWAWPRRMAMVGAGGMAFLGWLVSLYLAG